MNLYIRMILWLVKLLDRKKIGVMDTSILRCHVWPNDLDFNMHMNNGRYLTIMDIGRLDLTFRSNMLQKAIKNNYAPVLGSVQMRYRIPLLCFQAYDLESRLICWDKKWAYIEQRFVLAKGPKAGAVAAIGMVKGSFYDTKNKSTVSPEQIITLIGRTDLKSPPMPEHFKAWAGAENSLKALTAEA